MKKHSSTSSSTLMSLVCGTLGHDYIISRKVTNHINEYKCCNCNKEITDTYTGKVEALTSKIRNANNNVAAFFQKKTQHLSA